MRFGVGRPSDTWDDAAYRRTRVGATTWLDYNCSRRNYRYYIKARG